MDLLSHVLYMGFIQQHLTCLLFGILGIEGGGGSGPLNCGIWKSWVGMEGLTLCNLWCPESAPSGGQVFILMGCLGKVGGLLGSLKSRFLDALFPQ